MTLSLRERAAMLQAEFEALPVEVDGSTRVPPALRRAIVYLALDDPERAGVARAGWCPGDSPDPDAPASHVGGARELKRLSARLVIPVGFGAVVAAFIRATTTPASSPWLLFVAGVCLAVFGIVLFARQSPQR
jgi:hypothetical protein